MEQPTDEMDAIIAQLRAKTEVRDRLTLQLYNGPGGISILVQEQQLENSDLMDEHWSDVWSPENAQRRHISVRRAKEGMAITLLVVAGDKAAGKTTFFAALTGGHLHILQAFRYNRASFFNVWYAPDLLELKELLHTPDRVEPYFQTALAHGFIHMPIAEYDFFREDEEFASDGDEPPVAPSKSEVDDGPQDMLVKLLEIGGDFIQDLMALVRDPIAIVDPTKASVLSSVMQYLQQCRSLAYFINLEAMFQMTSQTLQVNQSKFSKTVDQLDFLNSLLPKGARILVYCSREPLAASAAGWCEDVIRCLSPLISNADFHENMKAQAERWESEGISCALRHIMQWALQCAARQKQWSLQLHGFYPTQHLDAAGDYDYSAVLRTLHRLLKTDTGLPLDQIGLISQQIVGLLYDFWDSPEAQGLGEEICWVTKDAFYYLLEAQEEAPPLDDVLHPMVALPPMVLLDSFDAVTDFLVAQGLALRWFNGQTAALRIKFEAPGLPTLHWNAKPPSKEAAATVGFRLPLHPVSRRVIRGAADLMASVEGLQRSALASHLLSDMSKVIDALHADMLTSFADVLDKAGDVDGTSFSSAFQRLLRLAEEQVLMEHLSNTKAPNTSSPPSVERTISLPLLPTEQQWAAMGHRINSLSVPQVGTPTKEDLAVVLHCVAPS